MCLRQLSISSLLSLILVGLVGCGSPSPAPSGDLEEADLLIRGGTVITMAADEALFSPGFVAVRDDRIVGVGRLEDAARFHAARTVDATDQLILPGLINGHQHAPMTLFRGIADDLALMDWLQKYIFPAEAKNVNPEFVYWGTTLAAAEMLSTGTTLFADMYYFEGEVARAAADAGIRTIAGQTVIGFPAPDYPSPEETLKAIDQFVADWKGHPLVIPAVAPHAPYTCSREVLLAARDLADQHDIPLVIHLAETRDEVLAVREQTGTTPARYLESIGFLEDRVIANHAVWVDEEEIDILKSRGVGVVHNPESNMKLSSGVAPIPLMLEKGLAVGLGTDGAPSNNNLDMFQEMDVMAKLHKLATMNPTVVSARDALRAATLGGAAALDLEGEVGSLEIGKKADLVILDRRAFSTWPLYDVYSTVVYSILGQSVNTVVVNGKIVVEQGVPTQIDREQLLARVEQIREQVILSVR